MKGPRFNLHKSCIATLAAVFSLMNIAAASEIDSFTRRFESLENSAPAINAKANRHIAGAIERANSFGQGCDEEALYKEITKELSVVLLMGPLMLDIINSPEVAKHVLRREDSIYRYFEADDGYLLVSPIVDALGVGMGVAFNFNGHYIGSDKFEHMFIPGKAYFDAVYRNREGLAIVLYNGMMSERFFRGGYLTGMYSYADLFADFTGMRFWNHILQRYPDVLGENIGPYVQCRDNRWLQVKAIDFGAYVNAGFDEGYNCSLVITAAGYAGVMRALSELNAQYRTERYKCPLDAELISRLRANYEIPIVADKSFTIADFVFNPQVTINRYTGFWPLSYFVKWFWTRWTTN